jgi:K+-sensing histidine kinase KdpD
MTSLWASGSQRRIAALAWTTALLGPLAVSGILVAFRGELFATNAALVLVLPVLAAAIVGGRSGGAASAVVAALCFDFFFTHPYYSFTISNPDDVETTIVLLVVGFVVGELVVRARRSQQLATASRREVDQVRRVAELAAGGGPTGRLINVVEREVVELLGARGARFERPPFPTTLPRLGHGVVTLPGDEGPGGRHLGPPNEVELPRATAKPSPASTGASANAPSA